MTPVVRLCLLSLLVVPWLAWAGPRGREKKDPDAVRAEGQIRMGIPLVAIDIARKCLEDRPDAIDCQDVLGRAAGLAGRCAAALEAFAVVRPTARWSLADALSEATCRQRTGDVPGAVAAYDESIGFDARDPSIYFQRGLMEARLGRLDALDADARILRTIDPEAWRADTLDAWAWVERGDARVDAAIEVFVRREALDAPRDQRVQMAILQCQRLLDVGDPFAAETAAREELNISRAQARLIACRAEAVRRQGRAIDTWVMVNRSWDAPRTQPIVDAIEVRALVDLGRLDDARTALDHLPDPFDLEALASAWYLARAAGETDAAANVAAIYTASAPSHRPLSALTPIGAL